MAEKLTPDLCVIGAGSGGLSVAAAAAAFGVPVVLIEKGKMGGDCLNTGCVPSKSMIAAARRAEAFRSSTPLGIKSHAPSVEFCDVNDHIHGVIEAIEPNDSKERFTGLGVQVIEGEASFRDTRTVVVRTGDEVQFEIAARRFIIATGSLPAAPPIPGLDQTPYLTNETVFTLRQRPKHLIIIGAGPIGIELAQAFRRLGSEVTVLEAAQPLAKEDPECAAIVLETLTREGVTIRSGVKIARVQHVRASVEVVLAAGDGEETIEGSDLLVATGRRPNIEGLNLAAAHIKHTAAGRPRIPSVLLIVPRPLPVA
jgi:pyruvate/2-oxoglutarate dehydrogenase complex dihydrolipoamide dehydrogenase (E3) component